MLVRVWRYDVPPGMRADFEREYGPDGAWAVLFGRCDGFAGTELFADVARPGSYLTVDRFADDAAWRTFREQHGAEYEALGRRLEHLTTAQEELA